MPHRPRRRGPLVFLRNSPKQTPAPRGAVSKQAASPSPRGAPQWPAGKEKCDLAFPCDPRVRCTNLSPGFRCDSCRRDSRALWPAGRGTRFRSPELQRCYDIDECNNGRNGGCVDHSQCINHEARITAGNAGQALWGTRHPAAATGTGLCPDGKQCDVNADCVKPFGLDRYTCKCKVGWAGDVRPAALTVTLTAGQHYDLGCSDRRCRQDNCVVTPNSGQEDSDGETSAMLATMMRTTTVSSTARTTAPWCLIRPVRLPTPMVPMSRETRVTTARPSPTWTRRTTTRTGWANACDPDIDDDGILNRKDNCPYTPNPDQVDTDRDGFWATPVTIARRSETPCRRTATRTWSATCATPTTTAISKDGINNNLDNCPDVINSDQHDADNDGIGDECDPDADNDGIPNDRDNCFLVYNPDQRDSTTTARATYATEMQILTKWRTSLTIVPTTRRFTPQISGELEREGENELRTYQTVVLDPEGDSQIDPNWVIYNKGAEIVQTMNSDPGLAATPFRAVAEPGIQLKLVNSSTGPGPERPAQRRLEGKTAYRWLLLHRPKIGLIRLRIFEGENMVADSGNIFDDHLKGGRLGVFCFSQEMIIWSDLVYRCNDNVPEAIYNHCPQKSGAMF
ncbi:Thrombospondin-3 [Chionoecetes opilio]|uniref:Thrombospondin-3 n=1 Tax=Chionoecetes opilio TaxID=41210 RepID=A0A8J4YMG1_CHIOP|nr:Thrombospondin-3 [Chionoecetes opilio]